MRLALNGWQRLWVVVGVILFVLFTLVLLVALPNEDQDVVQQLQAPECEAYRSFPSYFILAEEPRHGQPCWHLLYYQYLHKVSLHSVQEYNHYLLGEQAKLAAQFFVAWLILMTGIYLFGSGVAWVRKGFRSKHA